MLGLILTLMTTSEPFELIKSKTKQNDELTIDQKIDILAWRTEIMAQAILELDDKINYIINNCQYKNQTHVSNTVNTRQ